MGSIPESGKSPGEGNGNPLWYSSLENPLDRGVWCVAVHGVTKSWTWLSNYSRKTSASALLIMPKPSTVWITASCRRFFKRREYQTTLPASWEICMQVKKQQLELDIQSRVPFLSAGDLPDPRMEQASSVWQANSLPLCHQGSLF